MAIRPILIDKRSPFIEENCALCKEPFQLGEEIIVCPEDATRHHVACWRANGYRCTAYGCTGYGRPVQRRQTFLRQVSLMPDPPQLIGDGIEIGTVPLDDPHDRFALDARGAQFGPESFSQVTSGIGFGGFRCCRRFGLVQRR